MSNYCSVQDAWSLNPFSAAEFAHPSARYQHSPQIPMPQTMISAPGPPLPLGSRTYARAMNSTGAPSRVANYTPYQHSASSGVSNVKLVPLFPTTPSPVSPPSPAPLQGPSSIPSRSMYEATSTANTAAEADVESFSGSRSNSNPITEMIHQLQEEIIQLKHAISSRPSSYSSSSSSYSGGRSWSTATAVALPLTVFDFAYYVLLGVLILYLLEGISPGGRRG